jgi:phenylpropionate dioxygenase-like ring-hydroxylating dioxygenase large terminal subunit
MKGGEEIPTARLLEETSQLALDGAIDPIAGLADDRVWIFHGAADPFVAVAVADDVAVDVRDAVSLAVPVDDRVLVAVAVAEAVEKIAGKPAEEIDPTTWKAKEGVPEWAADGKLINVKCDYRLVIDNLMDLTHETYVHGSSIGNEAVVEAPFEVTHDAQHVTVTRWMENIEAPPFWASQIQQARQYKGLVDRWQIIRFEAPCTVTIDVGVAVAGSGAVPKGGQPGDRSQGVNGFVLNTITPETDGSCHYFWAFARNYRIGEQAVTHQLREGVTRIFREDEAVLEAQQQAMDDHPDRTFHNLNIDAGAVRARRLIDARIANERPAHTVIPIQEAA